MIEQKSIAMIFNCKKTDMNAYMTHSKPLLS
jgi:hypothetical protein